jgi:hypothetical protein
MNHAARTIPIEVLLNDEEKSAAKALCKNLGIGLSTWYRGLGNAEVQRNGKPPAPPKESRGCRGVGRPASRGRGVSSARRNL